MAELQWFYNDMQITNLSFTPLVNIEITAITDDTITSSVEFGGAAFSDTYQGNYFCQIVINGNFTSPSRTLVLRREFDYITSDLCRNTEIQVTSDVKCAGNTSFTQPSATISTNTETPSPNSTSRTSSTDDTPSSSSPPPVTNATSVGTSVGPTTAEAAGTTLQVWVYVLVVIAAVFGMIIVVLTILCIGLCLKKNKKTEDTCKRKL